MLEDDRTRDQSEAREKNAAQIRQPPEHSEHREHQPVQRLRQRHASCDAHFHHERMQPLGAIEFMILRGVNDVEPGHPQQHRQRENQRRKIEMPAHGEPCADGRNGKREAEKEVAEMREPLRERIEKHNRERHGREPEAQRIDECGRRHERGATQREQHDRGGF